MSKARSSVLKLNGIVSVKDYGAVGDGVTNDTTGTLNISGCYLIET